MALTWGAEDLSAELGAEAEPRCARAISSTLIGWLARYALRAPRRPRCRRSIPSPPTSAMRTLLRREAEASAP